MEEHDEEFLDEDFTDDDIENDEEDDEDMSNDHAEKMLEEADERENMSFAEPVKAKIDFKEKKDGGCTLSVPKTLLAEIGVTRENNSVFIAFDGRRLALGPATIDDPYPDYCPHRDRIHYFARLWQSLYANYANIPDFYFNGPCGFYESMRDLGFSEDLLLDMQKRDSEPANSRTTAFDSVLKKVKSLTSKNTDSMKTTFDLMLEKTGWGEPRKLVLMLQITDNIKLIGDFILYFWYCRNINDMDRTYKKNTGKLTAKEAECFELAFARLARLSAHSSYIADMEETWLAGGITGEVKLDAD